MVRRPIVVVTFGTLVACGTPERTSNPPPPEVESVNPPEPVVVHEVAIAGAAPGTQLNARIDGDGLVFRQGDGCVVYPSDGVVRPPGQMPPAKAVDCPPTMQDPAWEACQGGWLSTTEDAAKCVCHFNGNPPPPSVDVACPGHPKG